MNTEADKCDIIESRLTTKMTSFMNKIEKQSEQMNHKLDKLVKIEAEHDNHAHEIRDLKESVTDLSKKVTEIRIEQAGNSTKWNMTGVIGYVLVMAISSGITSLIVMSLNND